MPENDEADGADAVDLAALIERDEQAVIATTNESVTAHALAGAVIAESKTIHGLAPPGSGLGTAQEIIGRIALAAIEVDETNRLYAYAHASGHDRPQLLVAHEAAKETGQQLENALAASERNAYRLALKTVGTMQSLHPELRATLERLHEGLCEVDRGRLFYAFQPPEGKGYSGKADNVYQRRVGVIFAARFLKDADEGEARWETMRKHLANCIPDEFGLPPEVVLSLRTAAPEAAKKLIEQWQDGFSPKGNVRASSSDAAELYDRLARERVRLRNEAVSPEGLRRAANHLLSAAIYSRSLPESTFPESA